MPKLEYEMILFEEKSSYQVRNVTYEVIAHFNSENESLQSKIHSLLKSALFQKNQFAQLQIVKAMSKIIE